MSLNGTAIDRYVVIGNPIAHSKSPQIHRLFAAQTRQAISYETVLAPLDDFAGCVQRLIASGVRGANVTVPFKLEAAALTTDLSERARMAGAVNTLSFENSRIVGDNTDGVGLVTDLIANASVMLGGKRVLLIGAGGAARGVLLPLLQQRPAELLLANRTASNAAQLAQQFVTHGPVRACGLADLAHAGSFDLIINATSASLDGALPDVPASVFGAGALAYDMMYGAQPTAFNRFANQHGVASRDGLGMLIEQAAAAFAMWRGVQPNTANLFAQLRELC